MIDVHKIREDFPILSQSIYGRPLVYLDNAATTQKPRTVVEAEREMYYTSNANVHRGVHHLSDLATNRLEEARKKVADFIGAGSTSEIIFTRGTTESLNLIASSFGELLKAGDEIIVSVMEHHSNIVPWQLLAERKGITLKVIPMSDEGLLDIEAYKGLLNEHTRLVSIAHVSNVLGTVNPVKEIIRLAHEQDIPVAVDGAQSIPHFEVNVKDIDCDFLAFSGHKIYAPTGIGVLYGKEKWLDQMPPYQAGGEMISSVKFEHTVFERLPYKFEAGTPNYVGSYALGKALDYVSSIGMDQISSYEQQLTHYCMERLSSIPRLHLYGTAPEKDAVVSFLIEGIHHLDLGTLLDRLGIAVRTGHHCAQPVMERMGIEGTVRASFSFYNTKEEIDTLVEGIERIQKMF